MRNKAHTIAIEEENLRPVSLDMRGPCQIRSNIKSGEEFLDGGFVTGKKLRL